MATLPNGYTELEYIEGDGGQYIDLQYKHKTNTTKYVWDMMITALPNTYASVFGARTEHDSADAFYVGIRNTGSTYGCIGGTKKDPLGVTLSKGVKYSCQLDPARGFVVNGTVYAMAYTTATTSSRNTYLFAGNWNGTPNEYLYGRIYSFMIYEGSTLVRHYVPCRRDMDLRLGFYELIQGGFYVESKGNKFGVSPAVNAQSVINYLANKVGTAAANIWTWYGATLAASSHQALNVKTVAEIIKRAIYVGFGASVSNPITDSTINASICSVNTLKRLYLKMLGTRVWNVISDPNTLVYGKRYKVLLPNSNATFSLVGGGAGGGAGAWGATDKNDSPFLINGNGANGGPSRIYVNSAIGAEAAGGKAPAAQSVGPITNTCKIINGEKGGDGATVSKDLVFDAFQEVRFCPGYGGGGGGAVCFRIVNDDHNNIGIPGAPGSKQNGGNGEYVIQNGLEASSAGGGGGGGAYDGTSVTGAGKGGVKADCNGSANTAENGYGGGNCAGGKLGTFAGGGRGGSSRGVSQSAQTYSAGTGGNGGSSKTGDNQGATGGNGGASGSISITRWQYFLVNAL